MSSHEDVVHGPVKGGAERRDDLLVVENVGKAFPTNDGRVHVVLKDLSFAIKNITSKPQIMSLLGPSGSGKTTALRLIAGLDAPSSGRILISDGETRELRQARCGDVGVVFQRYPLFEDLTVLDNLVEPALQSGFSRKEAKEQALHYLAECDLGHQARSWPVQLSGGQRQRVAILQQLMRDRHFIILDEPFSGLDPINIANIIRLISGIANEHTLNTFIIITHDVNSALVISDRVLLLGRERDREGKPVPGARVMKDYDLISEGLAYTENIEDLPRFTEIQKEIKLREFPKL